MGTRRSYAAAHEVRLTTELSLFANAIKSIELGAEDFERAKSEPWRAISAVRNFYAGVLLLLKERLRVESPALIYEKLQPVKGPSGITWAGKGKKTVDLAAIRERWSDLKLSLDWKPIEHLRDVRNELEHFEVKVTPVRLREIMADTFAAVATLLVDHLGAVPAKVLRAEVWEVMLLETQLHQHLAKSARASRVNITAPHGAVRALERHCCCPECGSQLLRATGSELYPHTRLTCDACGNEVAVEDVLPDALAEEYGGEAYTSIEEGDEPPVQTCPNCHQDTFLVAEATCMLCEEGLSHIECVRCSQPLSVDEQDDGGLCSYCAHMRDKDD